MLTNGDDFLWHQGDKGPFAQIGYYWDHGSEMTTIARESLTLYPGMHVATALRSTATQLVMVRSGDGIVPTVWDAYGETGVFYCLLARASPPTPRASALKYSSISPCSTCRSRRSHGASMALIPLWLFFAFCR